MRHLMDNVAVQQPQSEVETQAPQSMPIASRPPARLPQEREYSTVSYDRSQQSTVYREENAAGTEGNLVLQEYFEGIVERVDDSSLQVRTVSSAGEEGTASLPINSIPKSEQNHIALGAELRISVLLGTGSPQKYFHRIRFVRPAKTNQEPVVDYLLARMKAALRDDPKEV